MPSSNSAPSHLQEHLLAKHPNLQWLMASDGSIIAPLFHQWGLKNLALMSDHRKFQDVRDTLSWALDKNVPADAMQPTFDWLHAVMKNDNAKLPKNIHAFLLELKEKYPAAMQYFVDHLPVHDSVWDTAFVLGYSPNPQQSWDARPTWKAFYTGSSPLSWSKKNIQMFYHGYYSMAHLDVDQTRAMQSIVGSQAFEYWQYGMYMERFSTNPSTPLAPSGKKYNLACALEELRPSIEAGIAPDPERLMLDTTRRYKGKELVDDVLLGLEKTMLRYEEENFQEGLQYCATMLSTIVPFAIKDGLAWQKNAHKLDKKITLALHEGRLHEDVALQWFEARINRARIENVDFANLLPLWPQTMHAPLLKKEGAVKYASGFSKPGNVLDQLEDWSLAPKVATALFHTLSRPQWDQMQQLLDSNEHTAEIVSLLQIDHPWIEEYKSTPRARTAVVAACMAFIDQKNNRFEQKYKLLEGLFVANQQTPIGQLSLPQPLYCFACIFPQYRETWQRLACQMVQDSSHKPDAHNVLNALASLMLGKTVDAQSLLSLREGLDPNMPYEDLVQSQMNIHESFELPSNIDETLWNTTSSDNLTL